MARDLLASYFEVGDVVLYGKYKNHKGKVVRVFKDDHGNPAIEVEPIPKGRKKNREIGVLKVWHEDTTKRASTRTARVVLRFLLGNPLETDLD